MNWEWLLLYFTDSAYCSYSFFSLGQLHLTYHYLRAKKKQKYKAVETPEMVGNYP